MSFYGNKKDAAQFVSEALLRSKPDSQLIMIITQGSSEACSVSTATDMSLDDTVKILGRAYLDQLTST